MCGIFGVVAKAGTSVPVERGIEIIHHLFSLSESRGSEAAGLAVSAGDDLTYFKKALRATHMIRTAEYLDFIESFRGVAQSSGGYAAIGHSRLVTNGSQGVEENNQPVRSSHCIGVHNGIVVNDLELWAGNPQLEREFQVDTEVIYRLVDHHCAGGIGLLDAIARTYRQIKGEANIAFLHDVERSLHLATNVGSLYYVDVAQAGVLLFASEAVILKRTLKRFQFLGGRDADIRQLGPGRGLRVGLDAGEVEGFALSESSVDNGSYRAAAQRVYRRVITDRSPKRALMRRCTRCILPHTFPFIQFDAEGVCNYCRDPVPPRTDSRQTLEARIQKYRRNDGGPDCIVALSGGRDSCYGLHYIKTVLGMNPIAYTYDWAMVTDEARRNCSRMCEALGVEHVIRSADILAKRRNIRLNIEAWLKRPDLGMIPLFMAGDKQFFHYATQVSAENDAPLVFFCGGNNLEVTRFKTGFCGVKDQSHNTMVGLDTLGKAKLLAYYGKNFLLNPAYFNRSLFDTFFAFYSTYLARGEFVYLYRYIDWDEGEIACVLKDGYGWESAGDSATTWRIGDGTAAFYNYIYHTVAGFTEHDTFRSNQVRAGLISRGEALQFIEVDNQPRFEAMREYAQLVGFNLDGALSVINNIPKLS